MKMRQTYGQYIKILALIPAIAAAASLSIGGAEINREAAVYAASMEQFSPEQDPVNEDSAEYQVNTSEAIDDRASEVRVIDCSVLEKKPVYQLDQAEYETLLKIVEAEAGGEDENGKVLVANVVLNRVNHSAFPDTVTGVVYQKENGVYQFSPVKDGRLEKVRISEETRKAVERAVYGEDISQGALYFMARNAVSAEKLSWFDNKLTWLFAYGGHEFFE